MIFFFSIIAFVLILAIPAFKKKSPEPFKPVIKPKPIVAMLSPEEQKNKRLEILNQTEAAIIKDDFTGNTSIKITKLAAAEDDLFPLGDLDAKPFIATAFFLSFICLKEGIMLIFHSFMSGQFWKGDSFVFLFDDETKIELIFPLQRTKPSTKINKNFVPLSNEQFGWLMKKKIIKCKYTDQKKGTYQIVGFNAFDRKLYNSEEEGQYLFQIMAQKIFGAILLLNEKDNKLE